MNRLGGMGTPIKVMIGDKPIFLCCKGCIKKIQAEPAKVPGDGLRGRRWTSWERRSWEKGDKEIGSVPVGTEQVREGIFKVSAADAPFISRTKAVSRDG